MIKETPASGVLAAKPPVVVVGAGGHALVSIEVLRSAGYVVGGCVASHVGAAEGLERLEVPVLGTDDELPELLAGDAVFVAVGDNEARRRLIDQSTSAGGTLVSAVSPAAVVSSSASIGAGCLVMPAAVVNALASLGQGAVVNTGAVVEHECVVGEAAHIAPGAVLAGNVHVGQESLVGVGARVIPGRRIGSRAVVGAGAVVIDDVPDGATVVGVPARPVGTGPQAALPVGAPRAAGQLHGGVHPKVLMVCTGNLCRSPLAEALLRRDLEQAGLDAEVTSAGLAAPTAAIPDKKLQRVAEERGVDVSAHRSRRLTTDDVAAADLVLVMTRAQAKQVLDLSPSAAGRVVPLRAAVWKARALSGRRMTFHAWAQSLTADVPESERAWSQSQDIADPIGRPLRRYREMAEEVAASVATLVRHWPAR